MSQPTVGFALLCLRKSRGMLLMFLSFVLLCLRNVINVSILCAFVFEEC